MSMGNSLINVQVQKGDTCSRFPCTANAINLHECVQLVDVADTVNAANHSVWPWGIAPLMFKCKKVTMYLNIVTKVRKCYIKINMESQKQNIHNTTDEFIFHSFLAKLGT